MKRVLISGGGIGGLAFAAAAARAGWRPLVVERVERWAPLGAGLILGPHAVAVCRALGLDRLPHHPVEHLEIRDACERILGGSRANYWNVHRADLHAALLGAATDATVRLGTTVAAIDGQRVTLSDGSTERVDLIVGADGIRSGVRALVAPRVQPRYAGYTCWRFVAPRTLAADRTIERWAPGLRLGTVPLAGDRIYVFACANAPAGQRDGPDAWDALVERFAPFGEPVETQLRTAREAGGALLRHDIEELSAPCWGQGRVILLGDAAHAMTPNTGSGAAMALEDALALGLSLHSHDDIDAALAAYQRRRHGRVVQAARVARQIGVVGQWSWPWACWLRDRMMAATPAAVGERQLDAMLAPGLALAEEARAYR